MSKSSKVTLISEEGKEFNISRAAAEHSGFLKDALSDENQWAEGVEGRVRLGEMRDEIVEKICEYLEFKEEYDSKNAKTIPDFTDRIPKEIALELLMAADYLAC